MAPRFRFLPFALLIAAPLAMAIPEGPADGTPEWTQREQANYARTGEAPAEFATPEFQTLWNDRSQANRLDWIARAEGDTSWVGPPSGNSPDTPAGAMWSTLATSDPTRYPDAAGPNGKAFYDNEGLVQTVVFYDYGCARVSAKVWLPRSWKTGTLLPGVVIQNGSIQASQTMYWWFAQALVRAGYAVMTFDPRGQGRSDLQTPEGEQGGNANSDVFYAGMVNAIDFFRSTVVAPYGLNKTCEGTYPTEVAPFNPIYAAIDPTRLGIAGHSLGAAGISSVQGYEGSRFQFPDAAGGNPVDVLVAWDTLQYDEAAPPRVPAMGQSSEYFIGGAPFRASPDPEDHKGAYAEYVKRGLPAFQLTPQGSTHFEWSLVPGFPATSWCADLSSGSCEGAWGMDMARHYSLAWFDRWLKVAGEAGFDDADARLLDDAGWCDHYSFYFRSARSFSDRGGKAHASEDVRSDCVAGVVDAPAGGSSGPVAGGPPNKSEPTFLAGSVPLATLGLFFLAAMRRRK